MSSPICLVNGSLTTNGVDVSDGAVVTIQLQNTAGVKQWSISCVATDDLNDKTGINSSLVVNYSTKNGSFTAPNMSGAGAAMIFESIINGGVDRNGKTDPSLRTRFGVFIPTPQGYRVAAVGETTEGNAAFGWAKKFNDLIRNYPTGSGLTAADAGAGLVLSGGALNVVAADGSITVNPDSIQVGVISDVQHGNRGGGSLHAAATSVSNGFMSSSDKSKLDASTNVATASSIAQRDANGDISFRNITLTGTSVTLSTTSSAVDLKTSNKTNDTTSLQIATGDVNTSGTAGSISISTGNIFGVGTPGNIQLTTNLGTVNGAANISLFTPPTAWNGATRALYMGNRVAAPSSASANGIFMYSDSGTFNILANGGSIITLGSSNFSFSGSQTSNGSFTIASANQTITASRTIELTSGSVSGTANSGDLILHSGSSGSISGNIRIYPGIGTSGQGNIFLGVTGSLPNMAGAQKTLYIASAAAEPSGSITTGGGMLFVRSTGELCYKYGNNAIRVIAFVP